MRTEGERSTWTRPRGEHPRSATVLCPVLDSPAESFLDFVTSAAAGASAHLVVVAPVTRLEQSSLGVPNADREDARNRLDQVADYAANANVAVSSHVCVGNTLTRTLAAAAETHDADAVLVDADQTPRTPKLARALSCDVVAVSNPGHARSHRSILAAVAGGPHSALGASVAGALARGGDGYVDVFHAHAPDAGGLDSFLDRATAATFARNRTDTRTTATDDPADAIVSESPFYDLVVIGGPRKGRLRRFAFGSTAADIADRAETTVVTVWNNTAPEFTLRP